MPNRKNIGNYVDGFVLVVSKNKLADYRKMAKMGSQVWMKHGALDYKECVMDDPSPRGIVFTFNKAMKIKAGEVVVFSYIVFKSKSHRNIVNAKVMKDPMMNNQKYKDMPMPFDMKRMSYGGFKVLVSS